MLRKVVSRQNVWMNESALDELPAILQGFGDRRILLVVDDNAYRLSGAETLLRGCLDSDAIIRFSDFEPNPKIEDVEQGVALCRAVQAEVVVAFGGGTAVDVGKLIASFSLQNAEPRLLACGGSPLASRSLPLVAIPTTAGTGSEATHFAVVYVDEQKCSVADECLLPQHAIIDPRLTQNLPPRLTAATGLDAFCQAIESIWSVNATEQSLFFATEAARLAWRYLPLATDQPTSQARFKMCQASHLAGKAINISKTTLPHAISYALTADYGMPHGTAVATTLTSALIYNYGVTDADCADPRGAEHVRVRLATILQLVGAASLDKAVERIEAFVGSLGAPPTLQAAGIHSEAKLQDLAKRVNLERLANNPRRANQTALLALLQQRSAGAAPA